MRLHVMAWGRTARLGLGGSAVTHHPPVSLPNSASAAVAAAPIAAPDAVLTMNMSGFFQKNLDQLRVWLWRFEKRSAGFDLGDELIPSFTRSSCATV
jgi:hypothetical protein